MPPPQKNSGNKKSKSKMGVSGKNSRFIQSIVEDARADGGKVDEIHIARVIRTMGNGRVEIFYVQDERGIIGQSVIRGSFRGKAKRAVWIEKGSIVAVADVGIGGSAALEIVAVFEADQIQEIRSVMEIDPRIFAIDNTDTTALVGNTAVEAGFDFEEEVDVDKI